MANFREAVCWGGLFPSGLFPDGFCLDCIFPVGSFPGGCCRVAYFLDPVFTF